MNRLRIGFLCYDRVNALDIVGPAEAFASAQRENERGKIESCYDVAIIGLTKRPFVSESGILFHPHAGIEAASRLDTLIVPGGRGLREPTTNRRACKWIAGKAKET